jgi:hypothetical protein
MGIIFGTCPAPRRTQTFTAQNALVGSSEDGAF